MNNSIVISYVCLQRQEASICAPRCDADTFNFSGVANTHPTPLNHSNKDRPDWAIQPKPN